MLHSGTLKVQLKMRFGIEMDGTDKNYYLLDYEGEILKNASAWRKNYLVYLNGLEIEKGPIAFLILW